MSKLFDTVKDKCKDMGLSEKHLKDLTEALGGGLTEDSTEEEVNAVVEQIVKIAGYSQGELTRKLQQKKTPKKKPTKAANTDDDDDPDDPDDDDPEEGKGKKGWEKAIAALRKEMKEEREQAAEERRQEKAREARAAAITAALDKYKVPEKSRRFVQNVPEDIEDVDKYIGEYAQTIVTEGLPGDESGQRKVPTQKETEDTGKSWFQRLTGKKENNE